MQTITLQVNEGIFDKFQWLMSHFSKDEVSIVNEIDISKLPEHNFDYISDEKLNELDEISQNYKSGERDDFEEYVIS